MIKWIRKNTGVIVSIVGLLLLTILTFGDIKNCLNNIGLMLVAIFFDWSINNWTYVCANIN